MKTVDPATSAAACIRVDSIEDLHDHEAEILRRIQALPNGGNLFLAHPFLLLADLGVEIAESVKDALVSLHPEMANLSPTPYHATKAAQGEQWIEIHLRGLFQRHGQ